MIDLNDLWMIKCYERHKNIHSWEYIIFSQKIQTVIYIKLFPEYNHLKPRTDFLYKQNNLSNVLIYCPNEHYSKEIKITPEQFFELLL